MKADEDLNKFGLLCTLINELGSAIETADAMGESEAAEKLQGMYDDAETKYDEVLEKLRNG
jgi:hypothetical protein